MSLKPWWRARALGQNAARLEREMEEEALRTKPSQGHEIDQLLFQRERIMDRPGMLCCNL